MYCHNGTILQDDEYLASLQADKEKELKAKEEAEAALMQEKHEEEEARRRLLEKEVVNKTFNRFTWSSYSIAQSICFSLGI